MGTQATGTTGTSAAVRQTYVVLAVAAVAVFAGVLHLTGAEGAEVVATLLFAVVFAATLLVNRMVGFATAGVATGIYVLLRWDAMDDAGTVPWAMVILGRAASYLVLAYVTDMLRNRLPRLPFGIGGGGGHEIGVGGGHEGEPSGEWDAAPVYDGAGWQQAPVSGNGVGGHAQGIYEPAMGDEAQPGADPWAPAEPAMGDTWGREPAGGAWAPQGHGEGAWQQRPEPAADWQEGNGATGPEPSWQPPSQPAVGGNVPSGWLQDEDYGDEIPVGYTGELFLQDLTGPAPDQGPEHDDVPMIDGMPFGQPLGDAAQGTGAGYGAPGPAAGDGYGYAATGEATAAYDAVGAPEGGYDPGGYGSAGYDGASYDNAGYQSSGYEAAGYNGGEATETAHHIDPETRLWTAGYFRDRLAEEYETSHATGQGFSVVMIQIPDTPFQTLSYRRQVALLRELGHQFIRAQVVDHLVHLPDGDHHWFAAVLSATDRTGAHAFERRLRSAIAGYLRNRGLGLADIQSATLTSPDDDATMSEIWASLLGGQQQPAPHNSGW